MTHTNTEQPEALRVANALEAFNVQLFCLESEREVVKASIDMIRRLYARVQELEEINTQLCEQADVAADAHADLQTQLVKEAARTAEETEAAENWRRLALQFDNHRMQAIGHLKAVTNPSACFDKYKAAKAFLSAPPLGGEEVLAQRIAALAAQAKQAAQGMEQDAAIEQMATGRYKVVSSHESMFHRWAVVAGTGAQQLYLGRKVECENMARKFAGAFLDGAFYQSQIAAAPQPPAAAPAQEGWCDGCSPDNCCGCGPTSPAHVQPKQSMENSHE